MLTNFINRCFSVFLSGLIFGSIFTPVIINSFVMISHGRSISAHLFFIATLWLIAMFLCGILISNSWYKNLIKFKLKNHQRAKYLIIFLCYFVILYFFPFAPPYSYSSPFEAAAKFHYWFDIMTLYAITSVMFSFFIFFLKKPRIEIVIHSAVCKPKNTVFKVVVLFLCVCLICIYIYLVKNHLYYLDLAKGG